MGPTRRLVELLDRHGVKFVLIGGRAASLHGSPLATLDTDFCYERSESNLERLAEALRELKPTLRGAPPDLPFVIDAQSLALGSNYTFSTELGDCDFLGEVEPIGGFEQLTRNAETMDLDGVCVLVMSLDDLIRVKQYIKRPKDLAALEQLKTIKEERDHENGR